VTGYDPAKLSILCHGRFGIEYLISLDHTRSRDISTSGLESPVFTYWGACNVLLVQQTITTQQQQRQHLVQFGLLTVCRSLLAGKHITDTLGHFIFR